MKKRWVAMALLTCAAAVSVLSMWSRDVRAAEPVTETYYLQAEVIGHQDGETIFGQVDGLEPSDDTYTTQGSYADDIPYLLTMDTMGTDDPSDDQILVVWGCMDGGN